jgi:WD40 repeat protein
LPNVSNEEVTIDNDKILTYDCPSCEKEYAQRSSLYRHQKKCGLYKEAAKLSRKTQIDIKIASKLLKQKHLAKTIPHLKLEQDINDIIPIGNITNNNTTNNNNNTTINNINIMVGNWETLNFMSASADATCKVWDARTGQVKHNYVTANAVRTCEFSYSGNLIMYTTDSTLKENCYIIVRDLREPGNK